MPAYNTIIVGGGFAGISAARTLHKAGKSFIVLEARNRLGGRVHSTTVLDNITLELGGQWIGPTQDRMYELVKEFDIQTFPTYDQGECVLSLNKSISTYSGSIPKVDIISLFYIDSTTKNLDKMAKTIPLDTPWSHPKADEWDSISLAYFLNKKIKSKTALKIIESAFETILACKLNEISLLHALFYIKSGKNIDTLLNIKNGAQQDRIAGGMQRIVEKMASAFSSQIQLEQPVVKIEQNEKGCKVHTKNNYFESEKVIVAIPPIIAGKLEYSPPLSIAKKQLLQKIPMGIVVKCYAVYKTPFWRKKGYSGQAVTDENCMHQTVFDNGPINQDYGVLIGFSIASRAVELMKLTTEERKDVFVNTLSRYFGEEAKDISHYEDKCWAEEEFSQGCYVGYLPPGVWTHYKDEIRNPENNIHWAGTETATVWNGYIEGAVRSGIRAANETLNLD